MQRHERLDATAIAAVAVLCALWGGQQVAVKLAVADGFPPLLQCALRSAGGAALCALWMAARGGLRRKPSAAELLSGNIIAVLFAAEFVAVYLGLTRTTASRSVLFFYTAPFFTALFATLFLPGEQLLASQAVGLAVAFAGLAAAFAEGLLRGGGSLSGDLLCALAAALWAATSVVIKAMPALRQVSPATLLLYQLGGSAPLLLAGAALLGETAAAPHPGLLAWASVAYQTVIVAFASYLVWFRLLQTYPATRLSGFTFLTPVFGILAGGVVLHEPLSAGLVAGLVAISLGLRLLNRPAPA